MADINNLDRKDGEGAGDQGKPKDPPDGGSQGGDQGDKPNKAKEKIDELTGKLYKKDEEIEKLKKDLKAAQNKPAGQVDAATVTELKEKVERMEFKENLRANAPNLAESADDLFTLQKKHPTMSFEEVVSLHLGTKLVESSQKKDKDGKIINRPLAVSMRDKELKELSDEELIAQAKREGYQ